MIVGPAGSGKTDRIVSRARRESAGLGAMVRIVVTSRLQAAAVQRRLAQRGGAIGVRVMTFEDLSSEILAEADQELIHITEAIQRRLLQVIAGEAHLVYFQSIRSQPGFVEVIKELVLEFKSGGITPGKLIKTAQPETPRRLKEIYLLYDHYQQVLQEQSWMDTPGMTWLAADLLETDPALCADWAAVWYDGFDDFTPVQLRVIRELGRRISRVAVTVAGEKEADARPLAHKRFNRTRNMLEEHLDLEIEFCGLPPDRGHRGVLRSLERSLFNSEQTAANSAGDSLVLAALPDREAEVRFALRWLKKALVEDDINPGETALLARNLEPYRPFVIQIAEEFGVPVQLNGGLPLKRNPAVAAVLDLLELACPGPGWFRWRRVVEAWRSPYFQWRRQGESAADTGAPLVIIPEDADQLAEAARWGSVLEGLDQWQETFQLLTGGQLESGDDYEEMPFSSPATLDRKEAMDLQRKFNFFVKQISPPPGPGSRQEFAHWVESLLDAEDQQKHSRIGLIASIKQGPAAFRERDLSAVSVFFNLLRGLVWAEAVVPGREISYHQFLDDLRGAVETASYYPGEWSPNAVLVSDVTEARGLYFRAAAVVGLAEGEFPQTIKEDNFLRDRERRLLSDQYGLPLRLSTESVEGEFFYEAVTRAVDRLLLCRPRIAENGALWQPSPFWEEVRRCVEVEPVRKTHRSKPALAEAASWGEFFQSLSGLKTAPQAEEWAEERRPQALRGIRRAAKIFLVREPRVEMESDVYDGGLESWRAWFSERFPSGSTWSASRLESYQTCPYLYFIGSLLALEPEELPREGLDGRQLGNIYHRIYEELYRQAGPGADLERLLELLPDTAAKIFEEAPRREGFRRTAWWDQTKKKIAADIRVGLQVLEHLDPRFKFHRAEMKFGLPGSAAALVVKQESGDFFRLRGLIDRVDVNSQGEIRIIDYKTSSRYGYNDGALQEGRKLQLPLYALAAENLVGGEIKEGFYFHVQSAEPSRLQLSSYQDPEGQGPRGAVKRAVQESWKAIRQIRGGQFRPQVPPRGCPTYCPAAGFCWRYSPQRWY